MLRNVAKCCNFALTVHTTLPIRTASQGVSFAINTNITTPKQIIILVLGFIFFSHVSKKCYYNYTAS